MFTDISVLIGKHAELLREYCQLASRKNLSKQDEDRLAAILTLAEMDAELTFLLSEADHFLAHELGLLDEASRQRYSLQQLSLRATIAAKQSPPLGRVPQACQHTQPGWSYSYRYHSYKGWRPNWIYN